MTETKTNPLPGIRAQHELATHRTVSGETITRHAKCSCGRTDHYDWFRRVQEHQDHVDAMIVEHFEAKAARARKGFPL